MWCTSHFFGYHFLWHIIFLWFLNFLTILFKKNVRHRRSGLELQDNGTVCHRIVSASFSEEISRNGPLSPTGFPTRVVSAFVRYAKGIRCHRPTTQSSAIGCFREKLLHLLTRVEERPAHNTARLRQINRKRSLLSHCSAFSAVCFVAIGPPSLCASGSRKASRC